MYFTRLPHTEINLATVREAMFSFRFLMLLAWIAFLLLLPTAFSCLSIQVPLNTLAILPKGHSNKRNHSTRLWCFPSPLPLATSRPPGIGQGIGNVLCAPSIGLLACQLQPGMPLPPPSPTDWEHLEAFTVQAQSGSSPKLKRKQTREPGKSERGSLRHTKDLLLMFLLFSLLCDWSAMRRRDAPACWLHAVPLWHHQGYYHPCNGSLSWTTFPLSSRRNVSWSQVPYSNILRLGFFQPSETNLLFPRIRYASASCMPWESTQPHCCLERHFVSQGRAVLFNTSAQTQPVFRHLFQPVEIVQYLPEENSGHALHTLTGSWGNGLPLLTLLRRAGHHFPNWCCSRQRGQCQLAETTHSSA